jgi:hypothetical protein
MVIGTLVVLASDASQDKNMSVLGSWDIFHTRQALLLGISSILFSYCYDDVWAVMYSILPSLKSYYVSGRPVSET